MRIADIFDFPNLLAFGAFLGGWIAYSFVVEFPVFARHGLSRQMNRQRRSGCRRS